MSTIAAADIELGPLSLLETEVEDLPDERTSPVQNAQNARSVTDIKNVRNIRTVSPSDRIEKLVGKINLILLFTLLGPVKLCYHVAQIVYAAYKLNHGIVCIGTSVCVYCAGGPNVVNNVRTTYINHYVLAVGIIFTIMVGWSVIEIIRSYHKGKTRYATKVILILYAIAEFGVLIVAIVISFALDNYQCEQTNLYFAMSQAIISICLFGIPVTLIVIAALIVLLYCLCK